MAATKSRAGFLDTQEGQDIKLELCRMTDDTTYNTGSSYAANRELYPDNTISFVDKHLNYLMTHPALEADKYLTNIKLITRIRR